MVQSSRFTINLMQHECGECSERYDTFLMIIMHVITDVCHVFLGTISLTIFHHNSNVMEISFCSYPTTNKVIATKFGTWHDGWAVMACAKFCCDMITSNWIRAKWNFHRIWIVMEKSLVKWVPGGCSCKWFVLWTAQRSRYTYGQRLRT